MSFQKLGTEIRQEQIARAVLDAIAGGGLRKLSMAAVARQVGLVPSAIYRHFKNKNEMIEAALDLIREQAESKLQEICERITDPLNRLQAVLVEHVNMSFEGSVMERILFSEEAFSADFQTLRKVREIIFGYLGRLVDIIQQGQKDGVIRSDADPDTLVHVFIGISQSINILRRITNGEFDAMRHAERSWRIYSEAIMAKDPA